MQEQSESSVEYLYTEKAEVVEVRNEYKYDQDELLIPKANKS